MDYYLISTGTGISIYTRPMSIKRAHLVLVFTKFSWIKTMAHRPPTSTKNNSLLSSDLILSIPLA